MSLATFYALSAVAPATIFLSRECASLAERFYVLELPKEFPNT